MNFGAKVEGMIWRLLARENSLVCLHEAQEQSRKNRCNVKAEVREAGKKMWEGAAAVAGVGNGRGPPAMESG